MKSGLTLPTAYLPPIPYVAAIMRAGTRPVYIEHWETFPKQTIRNRCTIDSPNGALTLSVPTQHGGSRLTKDIRLSHHGNWAHRHWQALVSTYAASPYFDFYADDFRPIYESPPPRLVDFNEQLLRTCLRLAGIEADLRATETFEGALPPLSDTPAPPYYQLFAHRHGFLPGLSFVDLLFNLGPESRLLLRQI